MENKKKKDEIILIGGVSEKVLEDDMLVDCSKCGEKTTPSGENKKRFAKKGVKVVCHKCGKKLLDGADPKIINVPTPDVIAARLEKVLLEKLTKSFIKQTIYCKKCNTELGHELINGTTMLNKANIILKSPPQTPDMKIFGIKVVPKEKENNGSSRVVS